MFKETQRDQTTEECPRAKQPDSPTGLVPSSLSLSPHGPELYIHFRHLQFRI